MLLGTPGRFPGSAGALPGRTLGGTSSFPSSLPALSSGLPRRTPRRPATLSRSLLGRPATLSRRALGRADHSSAPHSWTRGYSSAPRSWMRGHSSAPRSWMPATLSRGLFGRRYSSAPTALPGGLAGRTPRRSAQISVRLFELTSCLSCFPTTTLSEESPKSNEREDPGLDELLSEGRGSIHPEPDQPISIL